MIFWKHNDVAMARKFVCILRAKGASPKAFLNLFPKMDIKSTGIKNMSTGGGNHSSTGTDESIKHTGDQEAKYVTEKVAQGNPGKFAITPELAYEPKGNNGVTAVKGGNFMGSDAAHETMCKC